MLRHFLFLLTLLFAVSNGIAQNDLPSKLEWFKEFFLTKETLTSEEDNRLNKRLYEVLEVRDKGSEAHIRKHIGLVQLTRVPDYDRAMVSFLRAREIEDSLGLREDLIISYLAIAKVFAEIGDYDKSSELLETASRMNGNHLDKDILIYISSELGKNNAASGRYDAALDHYEIVLRTPDLSTKDHSEALFNLAHVYTLKKDYSNALEKHKEALKFLRKTSDRKSEAQHLNDIGELYHLMKNDGKALDNLLVALKMRTEINDEKGLAESYNNLGILFYNQRNFPKATENLQKGLESAQRSDWAEQSAISHDYLSSCWKEMGDFQKALEHKEGYIQLMEFIKLEKTGQYLLEQQNRFEIKKKESLITDLQINQRQREEQIANHKKLQNFLFALIGFGITIVLLTFYLYMVKRRANVSLKAAHEKLNQQNQELQNLNATKDKFFSIISHDLKGPLNSFTSFSKMLIDHTESLTKEEIQMLAREIDKNLKNVYALLENLLEWSRSQTGNIEFKPEQFDMDSLLQQNKDLLAAQAANKNIEIKYNYAGPLKVNAHKHSVNTVLRNLISNAIKFTPAGGTITLDAIPQNGHLKISVSDTGVGMPPQVLEKLFRIDTKYTTTGTANEKGTGLGLILCKDFIEKNGGTMKVESSPGKGSVFYFTLPHSATRVKKAEMIVR